MTHQTRRYVFIDFKNLQRIKFKKLEKVCDKIFVFIHAEVQYVPFALVQQMQKLGKAVRWIVIDVQPNHNMDYHISFLMGQLHQKASTDIEFAILSNEALFDPLVDFINQNNRSCIRVKRKEMHDDEPDEKKDVPAESSTPVVNESVTSERLNEYRESAARTENGNSADLLLMKDVEVAEEIGDNKIQQTAEETIRRLIRSGNRPAELSMLKSYILLHNQDILVHNSIEDIIQYMQDEKDIQLEEEEVIYNF